MRLARISKHAGENMHVNKTYATVVMQVPAYQMCTVSIDSSAGEGEGVSESDTGLGSRLSKDIQRHFAPAATLVSADLIARQPDTYCCRLNCPAT
jgi:hypothetical protein